MLPVGHIAAGYLTTKLAINSLIKYFPQANQPRFWAVGIVAAAIIDFDVFYAFFKIGKPIGSTNNVNHRRFPSHAPLSHLAIATVVLAFGVVLKKSDWTLYGILYLVGTWTHFFFDSFGYGLMWLWPFSGKIYALKDRGVKIEASTDKILSYWTIFLKNYAKTFVFYLEITLVITALLIYYKIF